MLSPRQDAKTMYLESVKKYNAAKELETLAKKLSKYARHEKYKTHQLAKSLKRYADSHKVKDRRRRRTIHKRRPLRRRTLLNVLARGRRRNPMMYTIRLRSPHKVARSKTRRVCGHKK